MNLSKTLLCKFSHHFLTKKQKMIKRESGLQMSETEPKMMAQKGHQYQEPVSDHCNLCGSLKKRDPTTSNDSAGDGQPQLKKRETVSIPEHHLHGFSRIPVPPPNFGSNLSLTSSDVVSSPGVVDLPKLPSLENLPWSPQAIGTNPNVTTPSPPLVRGGSGELPPLPPLRRTISEPLSTASPSRMGLSSCGSGDMSSGSPAISQESLDPQRFKRMMDRMKEMKQWWEDVVLEVADAGSQGNNTNDSWNAENEEAVSIERMGEYIMVCLKCPCSKSYQLLISGTNCYYKLM